MSVKLSASGIIVKPAEKSHGGRSERTRTEILNAAFKFLWSRPFREMTVERLMDQTSVSRPSFYNYFADPYELVESLLTILTTDLMQGASPWLTEEGNPVVLLRDTLSAEVQVCYRCGPFLKAITDAAGTDARVEKGWYGMLDQFDEAVSARIAIDQQLGLIEPFDPLPVARALNQMSASMYVRAFGQRPRNRPGPVRDAILRVWISTLYGEKRVTSSASIPHRTQALATPGP